MQRAIKYPIPIGRTVILPWDGDCHWRRILFASTLHHMAVLLGGWRLDAQSALREMRGAYDGAGCPQVKLEIFVPATEKSIDVPKRSEDQP